MSMKQAKKAVKKNRPKTAHDRGLILVDKLNPKTMNQILDDHAAQVKPKMDRMTPGYGLSLWERMDQIAPGLRPTRDDKKSK